MREIKFRAWIIDEKKMCYDGFSMGPDGSHWQYADQGYYVNNLNADGPHKAYLFENGIPIRDEFVLMQYTGLKDKNGKDIYEGDVVRLFHGHPSWLTDPFEVVFQCSAFALKKKDKKGSTAFPTYLHDCVTNGIISDDDDESALFEVIGNIHENPELLPK